MLLDLAYLAVAVLLLVAVVANYRVERRIVELRSELDDLAARAIERELLR